MKKINLFNSKAFNAFRAKALLFLLIFGFSVSAFASPIINYDVDSKDQTVGSLPDSTVQNPANVESAKIYISEGTTFYNVQEINGNVEIVKNGRSTKAEPKQVSPQITKTLPKKQHSEKPKSEEEKYTAKVQFRQLPFESNNVFSKSGGKIITVPTNNSQPKIVALVVQYYTYSYLPIQEKHNSKYKMSFANEMSHWQMRIRPPPAV